MTVATLARVDRPLWVPSPERVAGANLSRLIGALAQKGALPAATYDALRRFSVTNPAAFWTAVLEFCGVVAEGDRSPALVDPERMPGASWFPGLRLNYAENLLRFDDDHPAIIFRSETGHRRTISYGELGGEVARMAQALARAGLTSGDRVAGYLPNIPEAVVAMLATTSLGGIWSSCSPDFGVSAVVDRFGQIEPKMLVAAASYAYGGKRFDCLGRIAEIAQRIPSIERVILVPYLDSSPTRTPIRVAVGLEDFVAPHAGAPLRPSAEPFDHPLFILYSSGTTGAPKCIVHGAGGTLLQHQKEHVLHTDLRRGDRVFYYTTCGWMMWNWLVSSLATGTTVVLYDGAPMFPGPAALWDLADEVGITVFGTSAKWLAATAKAGVMPRRTHRLAELKTILSTGSPLLPEGFDYVYRDVKSDVLLSSISGGTDIISCFALGNPLLPVWRGELQCPGLGMQVAVLDDEGHSVREEQGELACTAPFPSMPVGFWNDADGRKYHAAYFARVPNVWCHGDFAVATEHDGFLILGRSDATLNPGGVRIGTAEIYREVDRIADVLESLAVGQDWDGDVRIVLFVRLRDDVVLDDALRERIRKTLRDNASARHVPAKIVQVPDLPRTISGKLSELAVRNVIHGRKVDNVGALANPEALAAFRDLPELGAP
jgi:acetoacetyl-CoA synthetase